jgi:hypothetical protein
MSEAKYYKPDISEFHIGFECEYKYKGDGDRGIWYNSVIESLDPEFFDDCLVRVKVLDHKDFVSLGWKLKTGSHVYKQYHLKTGDKIFHLSKYPYEVCIFHRYKCIFSGHILNISELRRLMRQLGITKPENVKA